MKRIRSFLSCLLLLLIGLVPVRADQRQIVDAISNQLKNKLVFLLGFYTGQKLQFDWSGKLIGKAEPGYWTSDGMLRVSDVTLDKRHGRLVVRGRRIINGFDTASCQFTSIASNRSIEIEVELDPAWHDTAAVQSVLGKVITRNYAEVKNVVPDYWRAWFGTVKPNQKNGHAWCETEDSHGIAPWFKSANQAQPTPSAPNQAQPTPSAPNQALATPRAPNQALATPRAPNQALPTPRAPVPLFVLPDGTKVYGSGSQITHPKVTHDPTPGYTEMAKSSGIQGTSILWVVVNEQGVPSNIRVAQPLGAGLDDKAVGSVQEWRFKPANYNGTPVAVLIHIEVNFHLIPDKR